VKLVSIALVWCASLAAQSAHTVALSWTDTTNPAGTSYNVYRAAGACTGSPAFAKIGSTPVSVKTYTDSAVASAATYCYQVTAVLNGVESVPSNSVAAVIPPDPPSGLSVVVH